MSEKDGKKSTETAAAAKPTLMGVLSHPVRVKALRLIMDSAEPVSPKQITVALKEKLPNVSYHVRMLLDAEVISQRSTRPRRGAVEHFYGLASMTPTRRAQLKEALALAEKLG